METTLNFPERVAYFSHRLPQEVHDAIAKTRQPGIWLRRSASSATRLSKLGGYPNLPEAVDWPRHGVCGTPLHFVGQIDLAALPATPLEPGDVALPHEGLLCFFVDLDEEMQWGDEGRGSHFDATRVIHVAQAGPPRELPADLPVILHEWGKQGDYRGDFDRMRAYPEKTLEAFVIDTFMRQPVAYPLDWELVIWEAERRMLESIACATGVPTPVLTPKDTERDDIASTAYWFDCSEMLNGKPGRPETRIIGHQMLGVARDVQGTAAKARAKGHILLLQIDTDTRVHENFVFCDWGMVQFWIAPEDLAACRFDKAWATTEGG